MAFTELLYLIIFVIFINLFINFINGFRRPNKFPPGPQWYPLVGNTPKLRELSKKLGGQHHAFTHLAKLYNTKVLGIKLGRELFVVVFGEPLIKKVISNDVFQARPDNCFIRLRSLGTRLGITMTDGPLFEDQKRFVVRHLRELGFGKSIMETLILDELRELIQKLSKGGEIIWKDLLAPSVMNVLWALAAGSRFSPEDPRLQVLLQLLEKRSRAFDAAGGLLNQFPWLRYIAPDYTGYSILTDVNARMSRLIKATIKEHKQTYESVKTRDVIDAFLHEMYAANSKSTTEPTYFTEDQLVMVCLDLFLAGAQTTSDTLNFALLSVLIHPKVQQQIHEEIDSVLRDGQLPSPADRVRYPYTEAVLLESQRHHYVVPVSAPRRVLEDTYIEGYRIPKGTTVLHNFYNMLHDKEIWKDPEVFRPERFLDKEGKFYCPQQLYLFGHGKRRCIGEALAKNFLFVFFVVILKNFKIKPGKETSSKLSESGITTTPNHYSVILEARH